MGQQAIDVLARWIAETVHAVPAETTRKEAERLAIEFTAFATDAGINLEHLEEDLGEDLVSHMEDALEGAAAAESGGLLDDE